jgi:hypothetical protein
MALIHLWVLAPSNVPINVQALHAATVASGFMLHPVPPLQGLVSLGGGALVSVAAGYHAIETTTTAQM